jgi:hypothetical protein
LKTLRITPLQFAILDLRVEKTENSEGRDANRALFPFGAGRMAKAKKKAKPAGAKLRPRTTGIAKKPGGEADPEGDVESEESRPEE